MRRTSRAALSASASMRRRAKTTGDRSRSDALLEDTTMPMLTGDQYRASLRDGRAAYMDGKRVDDVTLNPLLRVSVDWVAKTYDSHDAAQAGKRNPMYALPTAAAQLREQMNFLDHSEIKAENT